MKNILLSLVPVLLPAVASALVIESTFDADLDGWTKAAGSDVASTTEWVSTGGNPGGFLRQNEAADGLVDRIAAPSKFLGNLSGYAGGTLSFDVRTNTISNSSNANNDVLLGGPSGTLRFNLPDPVVNVWTTRSITLAHTGGWILVSSGVAPTASEFAGILANVDTLTLLADFRSGPETPSFDNIRLQAIPEPSTAAAVLGGAALFGLVVLRRRARS
jgi:hypothetical protein